MEQRDETIKKKKPAIVFRPQNSTQPIRKKVEKKAEEPAEKPVEKKVPTPEKKVEEVKKPVAAAADTSAPAEKKAPSPEKKAEEAKTQPVEKKAAPAPAEKKQEKAPEGQKKEKKQEERRTITGPINAPINRPVNAPINGPINRPLNAPINRPLNAPINRPLNAPGNRPASSQDGRPPRRPQQGGQDRRPQGDRGGRFQGDRGPRPQGDRPFNRNRPQGGAAPSRDGFKNRPFQQSFGQGGFHKDEDDDKKKTFPPRRKPAGDKRPAAPDMGLQKNDQTRGGKPLNKKVRESREKSRQQRQINEEQRENTKNLRRNNKKQEEKRVVEEIKQITLPDTLTIKEFASLIKQPPATLIKKLFLKGELVTINSEITYEKAEELALDYDILCEREVKVNVLEELLKDTEDAEETLVPRAPVICVMGHVDHGKTSLLDAIRETNVTEREAGGITQKIGAYTVQCNGKPITFLDTPGHEAFTAMRMRGAQATDIAILVVAADDGVMPQTIEAISHAKAAGIDIIVAINKIDKPGANIDRVKKELAEQGLLAEDWGGDTVFVPVSARTKEGIPALLEMILLVSEVKELKANPNRRARGLVIEAALDRGKGPVATILIQKGTLHVGDSVACGASSGKVRAMIDDKGKRINEAGPSCPVEIQGLSSVPQAGELLIQTENDKEAKAISQAFINEKKEEMVKDTKARLTLDGLFTQIKAGNVKELNLIVKADVQGSVEAVRQSLTKLSNEEVAVRIIHAGVGAINESDATLASASGAIIIGFNVKPDMMARSIADREQVDIRLYTVIYKIIEDIEAALKGLLDPVYEEKKIGEAVVRQTFKASGVGTIAGSYITSGSITRAATVKVFRAGEEIYSGPIVSLKRFNDDVKEVKEGYECGIVLEKMNDIQVDDTMEAYVMVATER